MARTYERMFFHFVWSTWDRVPLLTPDIEQHAYALIHRQCHKMGVTLIALDGIPDHVHLLVTLPKTLLVPDFMEAVKGSSSRGLNETHSTPAWSFKWQGGYGVQTVCPGHVSLVGRYVENQKQHHADGTLWPTCEPPDEDA